jgi:hypothetical protein
MLKAHLRLLAAHSSKSDDLLPQNNAQFASDALDQASTAPEGHEEDLYQHTEQVASKGGISDATGVPDASLEPDFSTKPNAQRSLNGSTSRLQACLRILADRLGTEEDDLTKDQENYGTHGVYADVPMLIDPEFSSTYARENNINDPHLASSTNDDFEFTDGFNMIGQEGMRNYAKALQDGDFDRAGRATGDRLITEDPRDNGYLNIHSAIEDAELETLAGEEIDADADPRLWNMANQPLGMAG